jgi:site-specific DNA-methyltransferase (adenine-specific)
MNIDLRLGNCLEVMKDIPDGSVDMVLTDPPYGTTACKWDTVIPLEPMWEQLHRIVKDNSAICLFGSEPFSSHLRMSNLKMFRYDWVWIKNRITGAGSAKYQPMKRYEIVSVFGKRINYFPVRTARKNSPPGNKNQSNISTYGSKNRELKKRNITIDRLPDNVMEFKTERGLHPTQKPVALMEYLVKTYTQEGETVLDFTMGSGTTGVACVNTGRKFIGIELDENYFEIAKKRVEEKRKEKENQAPTLFSERD